MGNPRKPTKILDLTGRLKHDPKRGRARKGEPTKNKGLGDPPERLNATQKEIWLEMRGHLVSGVALASDRTAFEGLVWLEAKRRDNNITGSELSAWKQLHSLFGLTPADRSRVSTGEGPREDDQNPFDKLG